MRKIFLTFICVAIGIASAFSQSSKPTDREIDGLKGKVKSVKIQEYKAISNSNEIVKGEKKDTYTMYKYDKRGNKIEISKYNSDESLDYKGIYKYDKKGNRIEESYYVSDGSLNSKIIYKYDDKGNKIEESHYKPDGSLDYKYIFKYDDKGNYIEESYYNYDVSLEYKKITEYKYDLERNWTERITISETQTEITERTIEYYE